MCFDLLTINFLILQPRLWYKLHEQSQTVQDKIDSENGVKSRGPLDWEPDHWSEGQKGGCRGQSPEVEKHCTVDKESFLSTMCLLEWPGVKAWSYGMIPVRGQSLGNVSQNQCPHEAVSRCHHAWGHNISQGCVPRILFKGFFCAILKVTLICFTDVQ